MAKSAAQVSRDLRDRKHIVQSEAERADVEASKARIAAASVSRSRRNVGYMRNSKLASEAADGERQHATLEREKAKKTQKR